MANQELITILIILLSSFIILGFTLLVVRLTFHYKKTLLAAKIELKTIKLNHEKALLATQLEIQEETFLKISKEIHDNISLGLTLAKLQLNTTIGKKITDFDNLAASVDLITKSLRDLNDISKSLDGEQMLMHGLYNALDSEIAVLGRTGIFKVEFDMTGETIFLDKEVELVLLRIFQESCNNILKHAFAKSINIDLHFEKHFLYMKITDDGKGFDLDAAKASMDVRKMAGLKNLHSRATAIGGELRFYSMDGVGTTVNLKIPINEHTKRKVPNQSSDVG
jgi:two-component system, NarL family, sensor kinase